MSAFVLTNNFYNYLRGIVFGGNQAFTYNGAKTFSPDGPWHFPPLVNIDGDTIDASSFGDLTSLNHLLTLDSYVKTDLTTGNSGDTIFLFGTDNTASSASDYALKEPITISHPNVTGTGTRLYVSDQDVAEYTITLLVSNDSSSQVSLGEVGMFKICDTGIGTVMLGRAAFESKIKLPAHSSKSIKISLTF